MKKLPQIKLKHQLQSISNELFSDRKSVVIYYFISDSISIKEIGVVKANILTNLIPIFTAVFSFFVLAEQFTIVKLIGMVVVMSGIVISQYRNIRQMLSRKSALS